MNRPPLPERPGHAPDPALAAMRQAMRMAVASGRLATDPPARDVSIANIRCLRFDPPGEIQGTVLHFHGGGYRVGMPEQVGRYARALADLCGVRVVCPAYRLAPEHPFPAGINDGWRIWQALAAEAGRPLILAGDSAGGGLAAGLIALAEGEGPRVDGLILLSPWLDLRASNDSYITNAATDPLFSRETAQASAGLYLQGASPMHPGASPSLAAHAHFPPTLIASGDGEVLADDAAGLYAALRTISVTVTHEVVAGMKHVAVTRDGDLRGSAETFAAVRAFVASRLAAHRGHDGRS